MNGAIPPLPQYAFMAWCLVTAQGQLHFALFYTISMNLKARINNYAGKLIKNCGNHKGPLVRLV
jgi:hypothetical protein